MSTSSRPISNFSLNMRFRKSDDSIDEYLHYLAERKAGHSLNAATTKRLTGFLEKDGNLWYQDKQVVRASERPELLAKIYKNDVRVHGKGVVTLYKLISAYYANITRADIAEFLRTNAEYNMGKAAAHRINKPTISQHPNSLWALDLIDCNQYVGSNRGWRYILTVVDIFSRYTWLGKLKEKEALSVANEFGSITERATVTPNSLLSDNGMEFAGEFDAYLKDNDIMHRRVRSHTPEANGVCERRNMEVRKIIRSMFLSNRNKVWYTLLPGVEAALNSTYISTIKSTPAIVWTPSKEKLSQRILPATIVTGNPQLIARLSVLKKAQADIRRFRAHDYEEGDLVRVKMSVIYSQVRALVKAKLTKQIVVVHSPQVFRVIHVVKPRQTTLERRRYILENVDTHRQVSHPHGSPHQFYGSDMVAATEEDENTISMATALKLNGCDTTSTDLTF